MCMMTVWLVEDQGDRKVMENVQRLERTPEGVVVSGLLDGDEQLVGLDIASIDFSKGQAWLRKRDLRDGVQ